MLISFNKKETTGKIFLKKILIISFLFIGFFVFTWKFNTNSNIVLATCLPGEIDQETGQACPTPTPATSTSSTPPPANIDSTPKPTSFVLKEQTTATLESTLPKETVETLEKVGSLIALGIRYMTMPLLAIIS